MSSYQTLWHSGSSVETLLALMSMSASETLDYVSEQHDLVSLDLKQAEKYLEETNMTSDEEFTHRIHIETLRRMIATWLSFNICFVCLKICICSFG